MINPITLYSKIISIQEQVMAPLYTTHSRMNEDHSTLLQITGRSIMEHESYIKDVCNSKFIRLCFNIIKKAGGCKDLDIEDFDRFTNYVKDGGLTSMMNMLKSNDKEKAFVDELDKLPVRVRENAYAMLTKSRWLHEDFVIAYLIKQYGYNDDGHEHISDILMEHLKLTNEFMDRLVDLAYKEQQLDELISEVEKIGGGTS